MYLKPTAAQHSGNTSNVAYRPWGSPNVKSRNWEYYRHFQTENIIVSGHGH